MLYIVDLEGMITEHAACGNQFVFIPVVSCIECFNRYRKGEKYALALAHNRSSNVTGLFHT